VANSACLDLNAHLPATGIWRRSIDGFKISTGLPHLDDFHNYTPICESNSAFA
jgi:hypothetical protein